MRHTGRTFAQRKAAIPCILLLLVSVLIACGSVASSPTPSRSQTKILEPFATADFLRFDSWSPDSRWIAYWFSESEYDKATLAFWDIESEQNCNHENVQADDIWSGWTKWQDDGRIYVGSGGNDQIVFGLPCSPFSSSDQFQPSDPRTSTTSSPSDKYSATLEIYRIEGPTFFSKLSITDNVSNEVVFSFEFLDGPHDFYVGPRWLNDELYLIGQTLDQGLLYYSSAQNDIGPVFPDIVALPTSEEVNITQISVHMDPLAENFHLLFEMNDQGTVLYHSETGETEVLEDYSFAYFDDGLGGWWSFSPEGTWLALSKQDANQESQADMWYRALDPPGSLATRFMFLGSSAPSAAETINVGTFRQGYLELFAFPEGAQLGEWSAPRYWLDYRWSSPDGTYFVARGSHKESGLQALFVGKY